MQNVRGAASRVAFLILTLLFLYLIARLIFWTNNLEFFRGSFKAVVSAFIYGMRFDLSAIFLINLPFLILSLIPGPLVLNRNYQKVLKGLFLFSNGFFILLNLADAAYFPFTNKRMQFDAFLFLSGEKGNEFYKLLPAFLKQFWYLWLSFIAMLLFLTWSYKRSYKMIIAESPSALRYFKASLLLAVTMGLSVIAIRGGLQLRPLKIIHSAEVSEPKFSHLILNSSFSVITTLKKPRLKEKNYFKDDELDDCSNGVHTANKQSPFTGENVVVIIIESFSKKYLGLFNENIKTPFLDSLGGNSALFVNGFANARESVQGIPAILSSIPSWQDEAFIFSSYSNNRITSLPSILKEKGYASSFFHGGTNGTMGFDAYCALAGFDDYFGRKEFNNEEEYDGCWGIWDEAFLQFMAAKLSATKQPFISSVFTLSPHHPFIVPEKYKDRFSKSSDPVVPCMEYVDYALSQFFKKIKTTDWYKKTLFVITADHPAPALTSGSAGTVDNYRIPIIFHRPDGSLKSTDSSIASQIDILPSTLQLMNYPEPYFSIGNSLFTESCPENAVNYTAGVYQLIDSAYCFQFNGEKAIGLYNWKTDPAFRNNLALNSHQREWTACENALKKKIQLFNNGMVRNKMVVSK